ncbi:hypothetical protein [Amycolatopsis solani]|uniref:hypothetical protein n=1 Tax=Amycolatopsis solani TaxID=3028615 RepID=UPI0025AFC971|nr:hypothetical protein [Amycolatopsis sp. MEP2-6]
MLRRTKLFALAAVLGSSAVLAARRARKNPKPPKPPKAPKPPKPPREPVEDDSVPHRTKVHRRLVFLAVLLASAAVSVLTANQETWLGDIAVRVLGFGAIGGVLCAVAWWRGAWVRDGDLGQLTFSMTGLAVLALSGPGLVTELVLTHRSAPALVEVAPMRPDHDCTLVLPGGSTPLRGDLRSFATCVEGERFTVVWDRGRFVRPMLPEEVNPSSGTVFFLLGAGVLAITVVGFGFPLDWPKWG